MASPIFPNELDRAIQAFARSRSAAPRLFRALLEDELTLLVPFHPEVEGGQMELKDGAPLPFIQAKRKGLVAVLMFSSAARAEESIRTRKLPPKAYSLAHMQAQSILAVLGASEIHAVLNCGCATGEVVLPPDLMRDLASGRALEAEPGPGSQQARFVAIDPSDYPTELTQAVFEFLKQQPSAVAAWIFKAPPNVPDAPKGTLYRIPIAMNPRDEKLLHEARIVASVAQRQGDAVEFGSVGIDAETLQKLMKTAQPFFTNPEALAAALRG